MEIGICHQSLYKRPKMQFEAEKRISNQVEISHIASEPISNSFMSLWEVLVSVQDLQLALTAKARSPDLVLHLHTPPQEFPFLGKYHLSKNWFGGSIGDLFNWYAMCLNNSMISITMSNNVSVQKTGHLGLMSNEHFQTFLNLVGVRNAPFNIFCVKHQEPKKSFSGPQEHRVDTWESILVCHCLTASGHPGRVLSWILKLCGFVLSCLCLCEQIFVSDWVWKLWKEEEWIF